ncbi:MAG TPA: OmpA family protein [Bacteroidales bacterium]|nr:OmpA family protein [Bacteroidales bacterium]
MRILITGFVAFAVWCFFSAWMYNDNLLPVINAPEPIAEIPEQTTTADSLEKIRAAMPEKLSIYFEFNKAEFKNDQQADSKIAEFRKWLEKYPESKLRITGHTDLTGTEAYNQDLAMERAVAVQKYIMTLGLSADRMIVESKGESEPAADYLTEEGRAKNRRTEILIKLQ